MVYRASDLIYGSQTVKIMTFTKHQQSNMRNKHTDIDWHFKKKKKEANERSINKKIHSIPDKLKVIGVLWLEPSTRL